jgi:uncharacterized membrane protein
MVVAGLPLRYVFILPERGVSALAPLCHNAGMSEKPEAETPNGQLPSTFSPARMEAFSDGVMAVIITIMVLSIHPPLPGHVDIRDLGPLIPELLVYLLSFAIIGIYWNNHHHLLRATPRINGAVMWANLHLLFWLSLIPIATSWSGENHLALWPAVIYGAIEFMAGVAYYILARFIVRANRGMDIEKAIAGDVKGRISLVIYAAGMALAAVPAIGPILSYVAYACVAVIWFIPDRRLVRR